jgi:hypothetical protein
MHVPANFPLVVKKFGATGLFLRPLPAVNLSQIFDATFA